LATAIRRPVHGNHRAGFACQHLVDEAAHPLLLGLQAAAELLVSKRPVRRFALLETPGGGHLVTLQVRVEV